MMKFLRALVCSLTFFISLWAPLVHAQGALPAIQLGSSTSTMAGTAAEHRAIPPVVVSTSGFAGESCRRCHESIRDQKPAALRPDVSPKDAGAYDVVIVGGGIAGLSAAYFLRNYHILILDKESRGGGKIRTETLGGHPFPAGGAYMGKPYGKIRALFNSLGIHVQALRIPDHSLDQDGSIIDNWIIADPALMPLTPEGKVHYGAFQTYLRKMARSEKLTIPLEDSDPKTLADLDRYTFYQWADLNYGNEVAELADLYSRDVFGVTSHEISAAAGVLYMSEETEPTYTWDGGLGAASDALEHSLGPALRTGAFVWRISQAPDGSTVDFQDGTQDWRARAHAVVIAVPSMIARRITTGLTDAKINALSQVRYSAYAVVPLHLDRTIWKGSFVLWTPGRIFTDLTLPVVSSAEMKDSQDEVLLASVPMGESDGRRQLLKTSDTDFTARILTDLNLVFRGAAFDVTEARVIRWGHAMPILYPGYLTRVRPILTKSEGRFFFAGVDTEVPAIEGAVYSAAYAADGVKQFLRTER